MNVSAVSSTAHTALSRLQPAASTTVSASGWVGSPAGPLSAKELSALRAAVGYDFAWPPTNDGPIPLAALQIAGQHADELAAHMKLQEMTSKDLDKLVAEGLIDSAGAARGAAVLAAQGSTPVPANASGVEPTGSALRPASGSVAADGSFYL